LVLSDDERQTLVRWMRRAKSPQALADARCVVEPCPLGCRTYSRPTRDTAAPTNSRSWAGCWAG